MPVNKYDVQKLHSGKYESQTKYQLKFLGKKGKEKPRKTKPETKPE